MLSVFRLTLLTLFCALSVSAQLTINGVADKTVCPDRVTFEVPAQSGFRYDISLNSSNVPAEQPINVAIPDYYELRVQRTEDATSVVTNRLVRFIVEDSTRVGTEWGLPPQTPFPVIQSSSNEFAGASLLLICPRRFPAGYDIPIVAWAEDENRHAVRANGLLTAPGHPSIQLRRGVGSGFLSATNPPGEIDYAVELAPVMRAAFVGRTDVVRALLAAGASPLARQHKRRGRTPHTARELAESKIEFFRGMSDSQKREAIEKRIRCYEETGDILFEAERRVAV